MTAFLSYPLSLAVEKVVREYSVTCYYCQLATDDYVPNCSVCEGTGRIHPYPAGLSDWLRAHEGSEWPSLVYHHHVTIPPTIELSEQIPDCHCGYIHALTPEQALSALEECAGWKWNRNMLGWWANTEEKVLPPEDEADGFPTSTELVAAIVAEIEGRTE
jgi:hypothetical protein